MHIDINDTTSLQSIRDTIDNFYPYLDIAFFKKPHKKYEASAVEDKWPYDKKVGEIRKTHFSGIIEIQPWYKVSDVEQEFFSRLGISVQLLRKEDAKWEQSTGMDDLTLKQLNVMGRNSDDDYIMSEWDDEEDGEGLI
jgi:hypothetical protein